MTADLWTQKPEYFRFITLLSLAGPSFSKLAPYMDRVQYMCDGPSVATKAGHLEEIVLIFVKVVLPSVCGTRLIHQTISLI